MKRVTVFILLIAAVAALPTPQKEASRIVGGSLTTINQYPFGVVMLTAPTGTSFIQSCGGTILNNRSVLSAAHCFVNTAINQLRSRVGSSYAHSGGTVHNTDQIFMHPQYNAFSQDNDFAVVRISGFFTWSNVVTSVSIAGANYNLADNQVVWAIGWGTTEFGQPSEQLRHVQIWTVNQSVCAQRYGSAGMQITNNMLCSGWLDVGGRDQCQLDSGGPLLHNNVQVGVTSWGAGCGSPQFPGVNARVSAQSNWIVANA